MKKTSVIIISSLLVLSFSLGCSGIFEHKHKEGEHHPTAADRAKERHKFRRLTR